MLRPRRRWDQVSWWFSAILAIPLLLILADVLFGIGPDRGQDQVTFQVTDAASGTALSGATVALGSEIKLTQSDGSVTFDDPAGDALVQVVAPGFQSVYGRFDGTSGDSQTIALRPSSGALALETPGQESPSEDVPAQETPALPTETAEVEPTETAERKAGVVASGTIVDADGDPIADALVVADGEYTRSDEDGEFELENADVSNGVLFNAPGYARQTAPAATGMTVEMERLDIKAAYLNGNRAGDDEFVDDMIALINRTELNAVVIDIKEGVVFYDTQVTFFRDADAVRPTYDPAELVGKFKDAGIYTIARLVVFNDPVVAEAYPDLAVHDEGGGLWRGWQDDAWVNPFNEELWQPNIDLALEAIGFGFDELQYDYIRFPSDGDLTTADFGAGNDYSEEGRVETIVDFLKLSREQIAPTGAMLAVDIFGIVAIYGDDQGIGQRTVDIAPVVDYVCPMIYPSHFEASSIDVGGEPNALPYETIELSVALALDKMPGMELKLRPWLQDFSYGEPPYGAAEVRAQIDAAEAQEGSGWLLWNAASEVTEGALAEE
ncbi:MAG: hypothetical protein IT336_07590 [Thermomicrobiales bacterium]|nr:hypothetical protein [Thermomicrobiales bacterium]